MKTRITPTAMDGIVVRWQVDPDNYERGEISASRECVMTAGSFRFVTQLQRDQFTKALGQAWEIYRRLAKASERGWRGVDAALVREWLGELGVEVLTEKRFGAA